MKKQAGFSLIELVVAMAVLALIMGAMVHLFGGSVTSLHTGARQEVVYEAVSYTHLTLPTIA